jgi:hypothetical protein
MAAINWQDVITSLGGNVVILGAVGWLIKMLVSNRFALDAEKFKIELKASADTEIERVRAFLTRASRVHERQVETLTKLHRHLFQAQGYLQLSAASVRQEGEVSRDEYRRLCADAIASAHETLLDGRLLIPPGLAKQCDHFFDSVFRGQIDLTFAQHPMVVDGLQRAQFWDNAQTIARDEVPRILEQIEKAARNVIHGEPP